MRDTEQRITEWISGVPTPAAPVTAGSPASPLGRTVVVETDEWIQALVSSGVVDVRTALIHRGRAPATAAGWSRTYTGTFTDPADDLIFADGFRLRQTRYGLADFSCLDAPTALVLLDEHDFSAFLRDADVAWTSGVFANHVTHPLAVLANVGALGGATGRSGPDRRLFVDSDGSISTSPFGSPLGRAGQDLPTLSAGWNAGNLPDDSSLRKVLQDSDRAEAISERPWLSRYFEVAAAVRSIRSEHLAPGRVSGFGGRLAGAQAASPEHSETRGQPDRCGLPVLVELGETVRAIDPATGSSTLLTRSEVTTAERVLSGPHGTPPRGDADHDIADLARTLTAAGLPTDWLRSTLTAPQGGRAS